MEIAVNCMQCFQEQGIPNFSDIKVHRIPDDGVVISTCSNGHETATLLQEHKFELLSENAINALMDGYYREAVASFAASLERFYEYYIHLICRHRGISVKDAEAAWKPLKNSSERQLGAFTLTYLVENGTAPYCLPRNMVEFRNDVIHKGKFPDRDDTIKFAQAVADCIMPWLKQVKSDVYAKASMELITASLSARSQDLVRRGIPRSTMAGVGLFNLTAADAPDRINIEDVLTERASRPSMKNIAGFLKAALNGPQAPHRSGPRANM